MTAVTAFYENELANTQSAMRWPAMEVRHHARDYLP
jgi:hypothetical protein